MVLPLLFSLGLPALAASGSVPFLTTLGASIGTAGMAGLGAGFGSFVQSGDIGDGIKTGLASFLGGKILGGLTGSTSANAINAGQGIQTEAFGELAQPKFLQTFPGLTEQGGLLASQGMQQAAAGAFAPGVMPAAFIGQTMSDTYAMNRAAKKDDDDSNPPPMPRPPIRTYNPNPYGSGGGEGLYFQYQRPPAPQGYTPQYPYMYADGGIMALAKGGEAEADAMMEEAGMNEKDVIVEAIEAIKGMSEQPEIALAMFVQKYGEDALRDLVGRVQSGELDDTVARFEEGDKGMVRGPGDGSGVDDMVPATLEGEQDVLLSDGEFVLRKKSTDALEKAYGGGFLDVINRAEEDAPKELERMVG
tara:strand:- start:9704 stop:10786 length:1083 start_codon:yes stop_codon:yes gene_type:complete